MRKAILISVGLFVVLAAVVPALVAAAQRENPQAAHGKYLVERVAMCANCHSPRDSKGEFIRARWLQGAPIEVKPIRPVADWANRAPRIAGLPGYSKAGAAKFLETALRADGTRADPPMPRFQLSHDDALAVVAFLGSLKPAK